MNNNINSSGIYNINPYNLTCKNATVLSSLNVSGSDIFTLINNTSTSILGNVNALSTQSYLDIPNLKATSTSILGYVNALSTQSYLDIPNLKATSTSILGYVNS